jgi:hypothetical protein
MSEQEWRWSLLVLLFLLGCGIGHELWKIGQRLKEIRDTLTEMLETQKEKES